MRVGRVLGRRGRSAGNAIVEFAFVLPVFLMIVYGAITYTIALHNKLILTQASREGARAGTVYRATRLTQAQIQTIVSNYCADNLITFAALAATCQPTAILPAAPIDPGDPLTVRVTYLYRGLYVFGNTTISAETTMLYE